MKILLIIDGSVDSDEAIETVLARPWADGTTCLVASVVEPLHRYVDAGFGPLGQSALKAQQAFEEDMRKYLEESASKLKGKFGSQSVTSEFIEGDQKKRILELADTHGASLIIMSASAEGFNNHWFTSIARGVIAETSCSTEVLRPVPSLSIEKKMADKNKDTLDESRYLIAINDSPNGHAAIESVASRPWPAESRFQIISVVPPLRPHAKLFKAPEISQFDQDRHTLLVKRAEQLVKEAADKLAKLGTGKVTHHVLTGNARSEILQIAQDWPADMIIMGAHDENHSAAEIFFGSTVAAVMSNATCSVELVKGKL